MFCFKDNFNEDFMLIIDNKNYILGQGPAPQERLAGTLWSQYFLLTRENVFAGKEYIHHDNPDYHSMNAKHDIEFLVSELKKDSSFSNCAFNIFTSYGWTTAYEFTPVQDRKVIAFSSLPDTFIKGRTIKEFSLDECKELASKLYTINMQERPDVISHQLELFDSI